MSLFKVCFNMMSDENTIEAEDCIYVNHPEKEKSIEYATELAGKFDVKTQLKYVEEMPEGTMLFTVMGEVLPTEERLITLVGDESYSSN